MVAVVNGNAPLQILHPLRYWGYQFWSGIGSDIQELLLLGTIVAGVIALVRFYRSFRTHYECHEATCTKLGVHHVEGTHFRTCWSHHPVLGKLGHHKVPLDVIHKAHKEATSSTRQEFHFHKESK